MPQHCWRIQKIMIYWLWYAEKVLKSFSYWGALVLYFLTKQLCQRLFTHTNKYHIYSVMVEWQKWIDTRQEGQANFFGGYSHFYDLSSFQFLLKNIYQVHSIIFAIHGGFTTVNGQEGQVIFFWGYSHFYDLSPFQFHQPHPTGSNQVHIAVEQKWKDTRLVKSGKELLQRLFTHTNKYHFYSVMLASQKWMNRKAKYFF